MRYPRTRAMSDVVEEQLESVQDPAAAADPTRHLDAVAEGIRIIEAAAAAAAAGSSTASVATSASDFVLVRMGGRDSAEPDKVTVERVSAAAAAAAVASKHHQQHQQQQQPGGCAGRGLCLGRIFRRRRRSSRCCPSLPRFLYFSSVRSAIVTCRRNQSNKGLLQYYWNGPWQSVSVAGFNSHEEYFYCFVWTSTREGWTEREKMQINFFNATLFFVCVN